jgi:hypothetical protein
MIKRISVLLITILFGVVVYFGYQLFKQEVKPLSKVINGVPSNAILIFESDNIQSLWNKISQTNIIWEELKLTETFGEWNTNAVYLDSIIQSDALLKKYFYENTVIFSAYMSGASTWNFLLTSSFPEGAEKNKIEEVIKSADQQATIAKRVYDGEEIMEVSAGGRKFSYTIIGDIFSVSYSPILIEDVIRHHKQATPLTERKEFRKLYETSGKYVDGNVFVNFSELTKGLSIYTHNNYLKTLQELKQYSSWSSLDLTLKPNNLRLNGFALSSDSTVNYLSIFKNQTVQRARMTAVLPYSTSYFMHFGISNFSKFIEDYSAYLEKNGKLYDWEKKIESFNQQIGSNIINDMESWIGNEFAYLMTEPNSKNYANNRFVVLKVNNADLAIEKMGLLHLENEVNETDTFLDEYILHKHHLDYFPAQVIGQKISTPITNHYTLVDDYLIFSESKSALRDLVSAHYQDKTLSKNKSYDAFSENLSSKSNILFYCNISRSPYLFQHLLKESYHAEIENNLDLFRKFEAFSYQLSYSKEDLFYNNIFLKYNPVYKQETGSLWEVPLDTTVTSQPFLVTNHYTQAKEVFVQDVDHTIYLISNTGKILWKRELDEPIRGEVRQLDIYKNNKLQIIFNTDTKVYVIDRNGKDVEKFPLKLKSPLSASIGLLDYDNNRDYRILVPCEDGIVRNFDAKGNEIKGWNFKAKSGKIIRPPQHIRIGNKDYVLAVSNTYTVYLLDRKGDERVKLDNKMPPMAKQSDIYLDFGKDILQTKMVYADTLGIPVNYFFNGAVDRLNIKENASSHEFVYADINNNGLGQYLFLSKGKLSLYDSDKTLLFSNRLENEKIRHLQVLTFGKENHFISVVDVENNRVYLYDSFGNLEDGMPLYGSTKTALGDLNKDGKMNLVVGSSDGKIYTYQLR